MGRLLTQILIVVATDPLQDGLESMVSQSTTSTHVQTFSLHMASRLLRGGTARNVALGLGF